MPRLIFSLVFSLVAVAHAGPVSSLSPSDFDSPRLQGDVIKPGEAKLLVLDFWASWCDPCRESIPFSEELQKKYAARGVRFIGVSADDRIEDARKFIGDVKFQFPAVWDKDRKLSKKLDLDSIPTLVMLDSKGNVLAIESGFTEPRKHEIAAKLDDVLSKLK